MNYYTAPPAVCALVEVLLDFALAIKNARHEPTFVNAKVNVQRLAWYNKQVADNHADNPLAYRERYLNGLAVQKRVMAGRKSALANVLRLKQRGGK